MSQGLLHSVLSCCRERNYRVSRFIPFGFRMLSRKKSSCLKVYSIAFSPAVESELIASRGLFRWVFAFCSEGNHRVSRSIPMRSSLLLRAKTSRLAVYSVAFSHSVQAKSSCLKVYSIPCLPAAGGDIIAPRGLFRCVFAFCSERIRRVSRSIPLSFSLLSRLKLSRIATYSVAFSHSVQDELIVSQGPFH